MKDGTSVTEYLKNKRGLKDGIDVVLMPRETALRLLKIKSESDQTKLSPDHSPNNLA
jgi:hypothetical protein